MAQRDTIVNQMTAYPRYSETTANTLASYNEGSYLQGQIAKAIDIPMARRAWDVLTHDVLAEIPYFGSKFMPFRDPLERYEKENIYGDTFAAWDRPYETIIRPAFYDIARTNPVGAAMKGAVLGALFSSPVTALINPFANFRDPTVAIPSLAVASAVVSLGRSAVTGPDFIPPHKQAEIEAAQYMDKFAYLRARNLQMQAAEMGDADLSASFERQAAKTLTGAKSYTDIRSALDSSDRKYLNAFLTYPENERGRLMASLPTYYQEALNKLWENDFGNIADHDTETLNYFKTHPTPSDDSLLWHPSVPTEALKIKMIQGGINGVSDNLHRFGFYESQGIEASRRFPSVHYQRPPSLHLPNFSSVRNLIMHKLRKKNPFDDEPDRTQIRKIHGSYYNTGAVIEQSVDRSNQLYFYMRDVMR
jgi:hypothetical protein